MLYNGTVEVSPEALAIALSGRKIEAIKLVREATNVGLKDAKDAVEGAMVNASPEDALPALDEAKRQIEALQRQLQEAQCLRREDNAYHERLLSDQCVLRNRYQERASRAEARVEALEAAITEHVLGKRVLPSILEGRPEDADEVY